MWNNNFVFSRWTTIKNIDSKQANVYIDLSGSMTHELPYIISVLFKLKMYIKNPFWAFSNKVEKAKFEGNKLISKTTGGTSIIPVFEHIKEKKIKKAIIITDGYFEICCGSDLESIKPKSDILFILVPDSSEDTVKTWGFEYIKINSLNKLSKR
jgi:predicted metal-dependent peptidase